MKITILALVFFCFALGACLAQSGLKSDQSLYTVTHYTDENGLPQNSVKSIAADKDGFIWLATEGGLVRFDGNNFYTFNKSNSKLTSNRFFTIQPDLEGGKDRFFAFDEKDECLRIEGAVAVRDTLYTYGKNGFMPTRLGKFDHTFLASGSPNYLLKMGKPAKYMILTSDGAGTFYVLNDQKAEFYALWKKQWEVPVDGLDFDSFFCSEGKLYSLSGDGHIFRINPGKSSRISLSGDILRDPDFSNFEKNSKTFWNNVSDQTFVLLGDRFYFLEQTSSNLWNTRLILSGFDFEANNIRVCYYERDQKTVILGSVTSGLFVFIKKAFQTLRFGAKNMDNIFYAQTLFQTNKVLSGNGSILGLRDDVERGNSQKIVSREIAPEVKKNAAYDGRGILTDQSGAIWSKAGRYLYKYARTGDKVLGSWALDDEVKTIYESQNGRIWLGMEFKGLYYIDQIDSKLHAFTSKTITDVTFLLERDENNLWVASQHGLYLLNLPTGRQVLIKGTEKLNVRSIYAPPSTKDVVFFSTYEDGVFFYNENKLVQFPLDANKYIAAAHCISEDKNGFFWIPTNHGLFQASKSDLLNYARHEPAYGSNTTSVRNQSLFYMYYDKANGFYTNEFNGGCQPCAVRVPEGGYLSLPSLNGLVWFKPEALKPELPNKGLIIDRLETQGDISLITTDKVELPLNPKQIAFYVVVPYYGNRNNLQLSYAILKSNINPSPSDWVKLKAGDPVIRLSSLAYGDYKLFVRKVNGFGVNNYMVKSIRISVPPDWYEIWWVRMLGVLGILAAIYAYTLFRTRYLESRNDELEVQIERRTKRLLETLTALQSSESELNRQMHIQTRLIASITHDIRTPLRYIIASANKIEGFVVKKEFGTIESIGKSIISSGSRMSQLLENTIGYIKTQVYGQNVLMNKVLLYPIILEKQALFVPVMREQSNQFINNVDFELLVNTNSQLLGIVIHNLIDNANKYTYDGVITISTELHEANLHLIIADTGPGIPEHFIYWLNSTAPVDLNENMMGAPTDYKGLGLLIVKEISALINAKVFVEKRIGTRFHLIFRIK